MSLLPANITNMLDILYEISVLVEKDKNKWIASLVEIETYFTAKDEIEKTIRALANYSIEAYKLINRKPMGTFSISLPYSSPIYSFVLYSCGIALAGNKVIVRPSKLTNKYVSLFYSKYSNLFKKLNINLFEGTGKKFINGALNSNNTGGLLFTGAYNNLYSILQQFPNQNRLIYCGSGINPFIVGPVKDEVNKAAELLIESKIYNSGQDCLCTERIFVHEKIYNDFCNVLVDKVDNLIIGDYGDMHANIFPPVKGMKEYVQNIHTKTMNSGKQLYIKEKAKGAFVSIYEVDITSDVLNVEKYSPIFTIAKYRNDEELITAANFPYRFGAVVTAGANTDIWREYPHLSSDKTIIGIESCDAHVPFGGCGKSGFSKINGIMKDGPILYSLETSVDQN